MKKIYLRTFFLSSALTLLTLLSFAQQARVQGKIIDEESGEPIPFATISFFSADSVLVRGGVTELDGNFSVQLPPGRYRAVVQVISYSKKNISTRMYESGPTNLGTISLQPVSRQLDEVVVSSSRPLMEMDLDKRVFNVAQDLGNVGRTASEILDNLPSITVDQDGGISLRGSQNVRILIDGKPSGLTGISSPDALRTLQGSMIERVEVVTNPSVRYEAEGSAGVINIVLKKEKQRGINGIIEGNLGHPLSASFSSNMNFRKNHVNYFINYGINYRERPGRGTTYQESYGKAPDYDSIITKSQRNFLRSGWSHNLRVGTDFNLNDNNTLTAAFLLNIGNNNNYTDLSYRDFDFNNTLYQAAIRTDVEKEDEMNTEYTLNYEKRFKQKDRKVTLFAQYRSNEETEDSEQNQFTTFSANPDYQDVSLSQRSYNQEQEENGLLQIDYIHPFKNEKGKFEAGYRGNLRIINTNYQVEEFKEGEWKIDSSFTNQLKYDERIHALYALTGNRIGKISYEVGVRMEATSIEIVAPDTASTSGFTTYNKSYTNFFPSIHTNYHINEKNSIQLSYSRRIGRPRFWWLNPFSSFTDQRNLRVGNPDLDPEFTDSYEAGFLSNSDLFSFYGGFYYRYTTGESERIETVVYLEQDSVPTSISYPINLSVEKSYGIEANISRDISDWWSVNGNFNFYRARSYGAYQDQVFDRDTYTWNTRLSNRFKFSNKMAFQATVFYRAPQQTTQGTRKSFYSVDVGFNREVFKGKATLTLSGQNIFNTRIYRSTNEGPSFYSRGTYQRSRPQFAVSLVFRVNQKQQQKKERGDGDREGNEFEPDFDN